MQVKQWIRSELVERIANDTLWQAFVTGFAFVSGSKTEPSSPLSTIFITATAPTAENCGPR